MRKFQCHISVIRKTGFGVPSQNHRARIITGRGITTTRRSRQGEQRKRRVHTNSHTLQRCRTPVLLPLKMNSSSDESSLTDNDAITATEEESYQLTCHDKSQTVFEDGWQLVENDDNDHDNNSLCWDSNITDGMRRRSRISPFVERDDNDSNKAEEIMMSVAHNDDDASISLPGSEPGNHDSLHWDDQSLAWGHTAYSDLSILFDATDMYQQQ